MQREGVPQFIHAHTGIVKGVAFSPKVGNPNCSYRSATTIGSLLLRSNISSLTITKDRYVFCSGGTDGKINVYNALQGQHTLSTRITQPHAMKNINAVKFNADGSRILVSIALYSSFFLSTL